MAKQVMRGYLSEKGSEIMDRIRIHCAKLKIMEIDELEMSMLANSFDVYAIAAEDVRDRGITIEMKTKTGVYEMLNPKYTAMNKEYQNILKHSSKFGLNPGDREKLFKGLADKKPESDFVE